jgi:predicted Zn-ribbon and HTH transcriptional regulator
MAAEACAAPGGQTRPRLEVADIFRATGEAYRRSHVLTHEQGKAMSAIERCRTAALGGHLDVCTNCGHQAPAYNSCRNRHCPKCQSLAQARWINERLARIIPTKYFHVVFTLPQELRALARVNPMLIYDVLIASAAHTLLDFGKNNLHAQLGVTTVLHTWTRDLRLHPHAHCIVTAGGLDDQDRWTPARNGYLFSVRALSKVFRGKVLDGLDRLYKAGALKLAGACSALAEPAIFNRLKDQLYRIEWVVYAKRPFGGPDQVFKYLGRYTHRVGISNQRLVSLEGNTVCFRTKQGKTVSLDAMEFVRRFLLHVLPHAFVKIRHHGLFAAKNATTRLEVARRCLSEVVSVPQTAAPPPLPLDWRDLVLALAGLDLGICPTCGGRSLERQPLPIRTVNLDTS